MIELPKSKQGQAVLQPAIVLCLNCNQAMQVVESNSTEGKDAGILQMQCSQCKHAVKVQINSMGQCLSIPARRRKYLLAMLALVGLLLLCAATSFGQNLSAFVQHKPKHFQLGKQPNDGQYKFEDAILYSDKCSGKIEWLDWAGVYSSSALTAAPVDIAKVTGKDSCDTTAYVIPDVRTITGSGAVIRPASASQLPLKDALSPPILPILDGLKLLSSQNGLLQIDPPTNSLVDLSSLNARFSFNHAFAQPLKLGPGNYVTNQLCITTSLYSVAKEKSTVRIFVQDEAPLPKGITFDDCVIGKSTRRPADFQIWYNGTGPVRLLRRSHIACVLYAPHATVEISPDVEFEGAIVCKNLSYSGGLIFFDKDLRNITNWR